MLDLSNYWPKITGSKSRLGAYFRAKLGLQSCMEMDQNGFERFDNQKPGSVVVKYNYGE
jgi:hypothetical protein